MKAWKDPVWSKLISAGLIVVGSALVVWILEAWPQIKAILLYILFVFTYEVGIPVWLLIVLTPLLVILVPVIRSFETDSEPAFLKYKNDNILGIEWSWGWTSPSIYNDKYTIKDLHPRCPICKSSLELNNYSGQLVHCINDGCNWQWQQQASFNNMILHSSELNQKVWNVIDRKIHNGEFQS